MLPGGDLYAQEERFFTMVEGRTEEKVSAWLARAGLPVIHLDGTQPVEENIEEIKRLIINEKGAGSS